MKKKQILVATAASLAGMLLFAYDYRASLGCFFCENGT